MKSIAFRRLNIDKMHIAFTY